MLARGIVWGFVEEDEVADGGYMVVIDLPYVHSRRPDSKVSLSLFPKMDQERCRYSNEYVLGVAGSAGSFM